jgi:hypothetical protein
MKGFFDRTRGDLSPNTPTGFSTGSLMQVVITCFNENGWKFRQHEQANVIQFGFAGKNANYEGVIVVEEDPEDILVLLRAPNKAPESRRLAVADFLARANYGMKFGAIEMNFADGDARFKMSTVLREGQLSRQMVHAMIGISLTTLDRHYPALMAVCFGNQLPSEAVKTVEGRLVEEG